MTKYHKQTFCKGVRYFFIHFSTYRYLFDRRNTFCKSTPIEHQQIEEGDLE